VSVTDEELVAAWRSLAREEGVFCEPASAAGVAGLAHARLEPGSRVVCIVTGHGLKDPGAVA
jgi:threonine synthase